MLDSPVLDALRTLRAERPGVRPLTQEEASQLRTQGNLFLPGAEVFAGPGFVVGTIHGNRFRGRVVLAGDVYASTLEDVDLDRDVVVDQCPLVRRTTVAPRALLRNSSVDCTAPTTFGLGAIIKAGLETPGREIPLWDSMTLESAQRSLTDRSLQDEAKALAAAVSSDRSFIGCDVQIVNAPWVDRVFLGPGTKIGSSSWVEGVATVSSLAEPVVLGAGVQVRDSILQWGVEVSSAAQVQQSILLEHSGAHRQALVTESLIGPNTEVGGGEVTASFLGPFVGFHHQSLLIATWWPEGRGNVGYGANVGSNHTSRAPDQELWAGEGTFFGLATAVKFPSNFQDAPYSLLASGVVTLPQRLSLPFSLIVDEFLDSPEARGLNRLIPGWVLRENVYLLLRNEAKYLKRNRARRHNFDLRIFRPEVVDKLWKARVLLGTIEGKTVYTQANLSAIGKNYLLEADRLKAVQVYGEFLRYAGLKLFVDHTLNGIPCDPAWLQELFHRVDLDYSAVDQNLGLYLDAERALLAASLKAKGKDDRRGGAIIPDYGSYHQPAEDEEFFRARQQYLDQLCKKIHDKPV